MPRKRTSGHESGERPVRRWTLATETVITLIDTDHHPGTADGSEHHVHDEAWKALMPYPGDCDETDVHVLLGRHTRATRQQFTESVLSPVSQKTRHQP